MWEQGIMEIIRRIFIVSILRLLPDNSALRVFLARDMLANGETGAAIAELEAARELEKADPLRVKFIESMIEEARHPR